MFLSTVKHGDCPLEYGQTRENVGLQRCWITEVLDYRGSLYKGPDHRGGVIFWDYARTFNIT